MTTNSLDLSAEWWTVSNVAVYLELRVDTISSRRIRRQVVRAPT